MTSVAAILDIFGFHYPSLTIQYGINKWYNGIVLSDGSGSMQNETAVASYKIIVWQIYGKPGKLPGSIFRPWPGFELVLPDSESYTLQMKAS
jgi:hypothetical protein